MPTVLRSQPCWTACARSPRMRSCVKPSAGRWGRLGKSSGPNPADFVVVSPGNCLKTDPRVDACQMNHIGQPLWKMPFGNTIGSDISLEEASSTRFVQNYEGTGAGDSRDKLLTSTVWNFMMLCTFCWGTSREIWLHKHRLLQQQQQQQQQQRRRRQRQRQQQQRQQQQQQRDVLYRGGSNEWCCRQGLT